MVIFCLATVALPPWALQGRPVPRPARTQILAPQSRKSQPRDGNHLVKRSRRTCSGMGRVSTLRTILDKVDERIGDRIENVLCGHHQRRLRKLGWQDAPHPGGGGARLGGGARGGEETWGGVRVDGVTALPQTQAATRGARHS